MSENTKEISGQPNPIKTLRDAVRLRPSMYFGTLDVSILYELICNVIDYAIYEAARGVCTQIEVFIHPGNSITIRDNGEGIPVETDPETGQPYYTISPVEDPRKMHWPQYNIQASRHGLGLPVINSVSSNFRIKVKRNGVLWYQQFTQGQPLSELQQVRKLREGEITGTEITFTPDNTIFEPGNFDHTDLSRRLRELTYLIPGLAISLEHKRFGASDYNVKYQPTRGIRDFVRYLNRDYETFHETIVIQQKVELERNYKRLGFTGSFDIALQYANIHQPLILSFMNGFEVEYEGTHTKGLIEALCFTILDAARDSDPQRKFGYHGLTDDDALCGLTAVLSMQHPKPESCNSIYYILANAELEDAVSSLVREAIRKFSETHPDQMKQIVDKCLANKQLRLRRRSGE